MMLEAVSKHHNDWINIAKSFGEYNLAEDIVHEMYIKLHKYCSKEKVVKQNGEVNKPYIYQIIKNLIFQLSNERTKFKKVEVTEIQFTEATDNNQDFHNFTEIVRDKLKEHHFVYERVYHHYTDIPKTSIRKLGKETDLDYWVINNYVKKVKEIIQDLKPEYETHLKQ